MANTIQTRLAALVGRIVPYEGAEQQVVSWELGTHDLAVEHAGGTWHIPIDKAERVVWSWEGHLQRQGIPASDNSLAVAAPSSTLNDVNKLLLESMQRVRDEPGYAPQAKAMAETAQVIINAAKVQVEAARVLVVARQQQA